MAKRKKPQPKNEKLQNALTKLLIIKAVADIIEDIVKIFNG